MRRSNHTNLHNLTGQRFDQISPRFAIIDHETPSISDLISDTPATTPPDLIVIK